MTDEQRGQRVEEAAPPARSMASAKKRTSLRKTAPIIVPLADAKGLRPGDDIIAYVDGNRDGALAYALAKQDYVQIRSHRLRIREPIPSRR